MNVISEDIEEDTPWTTRFADNLVIHDRKVIRIEERLKTWHENSENSGLKVRLYLGHSQSGHAYRIEIV